MSNIKKKEKSKSSSQQSLDRYLTKDVNVSNKTTLDQELKDKFMASMFSDDCQDYPSATSNKIMSTTTPESSGATSSTAVDFGSFQADDYEDGISPSPIDFDFNTQIEKLKSFKFPLTGPKNDRRSFKLQWTQKFKWIEYSITLNVAFCYVCRKFGQKSKDTFTTVGFSNWKNALSDDKGFMKHEQSNSHIHAMNRQMEYVNRVKSNTSVSNMINDTVLLKRRYYMRAIIKAILFLVGHGLALRGNWDKEEQEEVGLFNCLFDFARENDPEIKNCERCMPKNITYMSPEIQNEIIGVMAKLLREKIVAEVNTSDVKFFTILFDGTKDKNGIEIISLAARFISKGIAKEALIFFEMSTDLDAEAFTKLTLNSLNSYGLNALTIISQCYDGAAVMKGYKSGVAKRLQDELQKIIPYVHCFNHRLHLVIVETVKQIPDVRQIFDQLQLLYNLFRKPKIKAIFNRKSLKRVLDTRWTGHRNAIKGFIDNYQEIVATLQTINESNPKDMDGDDIATCTGVIVLNDIFSVVAPADIVFQKHEIGYRRAIPILESVRSSIADYRTTEGFEKFVEKSSNLRKEELSETVNSRPAREKRRSTLLKHFVIEESIGERSSDEIVLKSIYFETIDTILSELDARFTENNQILLALSNSSNMDLSEMEYLQELGIQLPSEHEMTVAKKYIERKRSEHDKMIEEMKKKRKGSKEKYEPRFNLLKTLFEVREIFPAVYDLYATIDTFGCSTAICECSFSALSRIDVPFRQSMKNVRLRNLAFLAFEHKRLEEIDIDDILKEFNKLKDRKVQLF